MTLMRADRDQDDDAEVADRDGYLARGMFA